MGPIAVACAFPYARDAGSSSDPVRSSFAATLQPEDLVFSSPARCFSGRLAGGGPQPENSPEAIGAFGVRRPDCAFIRPGMTGRVRRVEPRRFKAASSRRTPKKSTSTKCCRCQTPKGLRACVRSSIEALKGRKNIAQGKSAARRTPPWVHGIPHVRALKGRKRNGANSFSHTL